MKLLLRLVALAVLAGFGSPALAQTTTGASTGSARVETRPATSTFLGDTGLWFVPTGEVLPAKKASGGFYYVNQDFPESFVDIANFEGVFGYGLGDRAEIFGSFQAYRRIDTDARPLLAVGAPVENPNPVDGWRTGVGDLFVGAKINLTSQWRQQPAAFAIRGVVKVPTASFDDGLGTGEPDFLVDGIVSKELQNNVEVSGYAGVAVRGKPNGIDAPGGFRYGFGVAAPTRKSLRFVGEIFGEKYFDETITATQLVGGSTVAGVRPSSYTVKSPLDVFLGVDYLHRSGFFFGAGFRANLSFNKRTDYLTGPDVVNRAGDNMGGQVRFGYHPGVRIYVPPAPPPPPPPQARSNRPPTVKARCEPCVVQVGKSSTITADGQDPDGDTLAYKWSVPTGRIANPADRQTLWTAPEQEGSVPVTVTVDDGKGGTATDTVTIQVVKPPVREYKFEDVHFDFDRYSLRAEATRVLDEVVRALADNPDLKIEIEGHTCSIGTAEYNVGLGEKRAQSVREYLTSRGVGADRLKTVSYGEERPKYDNAREETRRLNRRAGLVVRLTQ